MHDDSSCQCYFEVQLKLINEEVNTQEDPRTSVRTIVLRSQLRSSRNVKMREDVMTFDWDGIKYRRGLSRLRYVRWIQMSV